MYVRKNRANGASGPSGGSENSRTATRAPGFATLIISLSADSRSGILRMPKEMHTLSNVFEGYSIACASPWIRVTVLDRSAAATFSRPISSIFAEGSSPVTFAPRLDASRDIMIATSAVPVARSRTLSSLVMSRASTSARRHATSDPREMTLLTMS
eukprot:CAMPEP_0185775286 /NCGR_PEP_ID=MMETSP1174-20130828/81529_1 /TAXON_ID=35687 /ORGANISM="Dictyocha speculum, Strain CCMP1381" /LENGTH=155 /DNA_ID=CAMNT_0028462809 /DNA_START=365 /DNA_END=832 /DNA_ORIENTATION=+